MKKLTNSILEKYINQNNWPKGLEASKEFAHKAIKEWIFKDKQKKFHIEVENATSVAKVQQIICNTFLSGEGLSTIKRYK